MLAHPQLVLFSRLPTNLLPHLLLRSLSFFVLQIMSAHTYTLLSDLKVITTGVLGYLVLDKRLNRQAIVSLCLLFMGISIGHFATLEGEGPPSAKVATAAASNSAQHIWLLGLLTMVLIAVLSAIAAVYTEWVMNFSSDYRHESLNLQNMRLYVSGTLLNGLYCLFHSKAALTSFSDMRPAHWVLVVMYAIMGLLTVSCGLIRGVSRYGTHHGGGLHSRLSGLFGLAACSTCRQHTSAYNCALLHARAASGGAGKVVRAVLTESTVPQDTSGAHEPHFTVHPSYFREPDSMLAC